MNLSEATERLKNHPEIKYFIFGVRGNDADFTFDACACVSKKDYENEVKKFIKWKTYSLTEIEKP
jgi:hypothetical protein